MTAAVSQENAMLTRRPLTDRVKMFLLHLLRDALSDLQLLWGMVEDGRPVLCTWSVRR